MKSIIAIFFFYLSISANLYSQRIQPLPLPSFTEADPIWSFMPSWEGHIGRPLDSLEFNIIRIESIKSKNDNIIITTSNDFQNSDSAFVFKIQDGFGVHNINKETGSINWSNYYNHFHGAEDFVTAQKRNIRISSDKIFITGNRSNQEKSINKFDFAYRLVYDLENGNLLSHDYDHIDSTKLESKWGSNAGLYIPKLDQGGYLHFHCGSSGYKETTKFAMQFQWLNETMDSTGGNFIYFYSVPDNPTVFSYYHKYKYELLNDSMLVVMIPSLDIDTTSKSTVELVWLDISDINNIHIARTKRIEDLAIFNTWNYKATIMKAHDNDIYICDFYLDTISNRRHTYLLHLDGGDGSVISYVPDIKVGDNHYGRINNILYIDDDKVYLEVLGAVNGFAGSDILSIHSDGEIKFETSITTEHLWDEDFRAVYVGERGLITDDGILILPRTVYQEVEIPSGFIWHNATNYVVAWDVRDFGMEWNPSNTKNITDNKKYDITIFPNPTDGRIKLDITSLESIDVNIGVYDALGKQVRTITTSSNSTEINYDISSLPNGIYYIQVYNNKKELVSKKKIVKI